MVQEHLELDFKSYLGLHVILFHCLLGNLLEGIDRPVCLEFRKIDIPIHSFTKPFT